MKKDQRKTGKNMQSTAKKGAQVRKAEAGAPVKKRSVEAGKPAGPVRKATEPEKKRSRRIEIMDFDLETEDLSEPAAEAYGGQMPDKPVSVSDDTLELLDVEELLASQGKEKRAGDGDVRKAKEKPASDSKARRKDGGGPGSVPRQNSAKPYRAENGKAGKRKRKKGGFFEDFGLMDVVIGLTGVAAVVIAFFTISVLSNARTVQGQVEAMAQVGEKMEGIGIAGEGVFTAVADARLAMQEAADLVAEESESQDGYEEKELTTDVSVALKLTSVQKDLKIKFTNKNTGKLIGNQAFAVSIQGPEKLTKTDDDKDGIIYISSITPGEYTVTVTAPETIDGSSVSGVKGVVTVKDQIEYKKIDVADEVKKESEINTAKEDTAVANQVESVLTDTVEWVESTKTPISGGSVSYEEVKKSEIPEPSASAALDMIWTADTKNGAYQPANTAASASFLSASASAIAETTGGVFFTEDTVRTADAGLSGTAGAFFTEESTTTVETASEQPSTETEKPTETVPPSEAEKPAVTDIDLAADSSRVEVGKSVTLTASVKMSDGSSYDGSINWSADGGSLSGSGTSATLTSGSEGTVTVTASAGGMSAAVGVEFYKEQAPEEVMVTQISISPDSLSLTKDQTSKLTASVQPSDAKDKSVEWKVIEGDAATVGSDGTVTAKKAGTARIQATAKDGSGVASNVCTVTVTEAQAEEVSVSLDSSNPASLQIGKEAQFKCTTKGSIESVKWSVSDSKIATIEESSGKARGVATGKVTVTVTVKGKNGKTASASTAVEVKAASVDGVSLDTSSFTMKTKEKKTIKATVSGGSNKAVEWKVSDESIVKFADRQDASCIVEGIKPGKVTLTATSKENGDKKASIEITVELSDGSALLKDKNGNQLYVKSGDTYKEATVADYYKYDVFYRKKDTSQYRYTGWQTIDGKRYYFDKNGNPVTGDQIIQGMKYTFNSDGSLVTTGVMGIDVSKHNGSIDWNAVKNAGVDFVIIRCGYRGSATGVLVEDEKFKTNIQGATAAGLKVGIYYFSQAVNEVEAVEEASAAISLIRNYKITYPVYMDVESANGRADGLDAATRTKVIRAFCETIRNSGYTAGVYANKTWLGSKMNVSSLGSYKIWLAQYAAVPTYSGRYEMWQYSSTGKIPGISGNVDLNISYMSY